jgi:hypothetical protein
MIKTALLVGCPVHTENYLAPINSGAPIYFDLTRPGAIRMKSWGGPVQFATAFYRGTFVMSDSRVVHVQGDVWCDEGIGLFDTY